MAKIEHIRAKILSGYEVETRLYTMMICDFPLVSFAEQKKCVSLQDIS